MASRPTRSAARGKCYTEPREGDIERWGEKEERWQRDWASDTEEAGGAPATTPPRQATPTTLTTRHRRPDTRAGERRARAVARREAVDAAAAAAQRQAATDLQTEADSAKRLREWIEANRNANTQSTYSSGWRQFLRWLEDVGNPVRAAADRIDPERPAGLDIANYLRYCVEVKGATMASVTTALTAIADHLRPITTAAYDPCKAPIVGQVRAVLVPMATPAQQKKEMSSELLHRIIAAATAGPYMQGYTIGRRDACMIALGFHMLLRASEIVRLNRGDISFAKEPNRKGEMRAYVIVHIDRMCKNDKERKGHERVVEDVEEDRDRLRFSFNHDDSNPAHLMRSHIDMWRAEPMEKQIGQWSYRFPTPESQAPLPLFQTERGHQRMSPDTPRSRLRYWLEKVGVPDASLYGFHSLRAGGATEAARRGVSKKQIQLHGNWKSDAVDLYIRPDIEDRLAVSQALNASSAAAAAR